MTPGTGLATLPPRNVTHLQRRLDADLLTVADHLARTTRAWALLDGPTGEPHGPVLALATGPVLELDSMEDLPASISAPGGGFTGGHITLASYDEGRAALGVRTRHTPRVPPVLAFEARAWIEPRDPGRGAILHTIAPTPTGARRLQEETLDDLPQRRTGAPAPAEPPTATLHGVTPDVDHYARMVEEARAWIHEGHAYQVNLALAFEGSLEGDPWPIYRHLRRTNPSPHMGYLQAGDEIVCSCSPELLIRTEGRHAWTRPIAGTRPRGDTPPRDAALEAELKANIKERAEHMMLVDLARNDLGRVAQGGTVHVSELGVIERYSHVMHLVSQVEGTLRPGLGPLDAFRAAHPCGTITGAPKHRVMELIDAIEPAPRDRFTGALGFVSGASARWNILIRTLEIVGTRARIMAGAGIVADSDPEAEARECLAKAAALAEVLDWRPG